MSLYECDGCMEPIRPDKARIQCNICTDYNLCANCFVIQNVTRTHVTSHPTAIYKLSGTTTPVVPPPFPPRPVPLLPPRRDTLTTPSKKVELPTANWGALWDIVKPKNKKATSSNKGSVGGGDLISISPPSTEEGGGFIPHHQSHLSFSDSHITKLRPDLPPRPGQIELEAFTNPYASMAPPVPNEWSPFFQKDGSQNAIFVDLMTTIFLCLDVESTGSLSPEVYSAFLDMQGVKMEDNIWQKTLFTEGGIQNQEIADLELGIYLKTHDISHTLAVRNASNLPPPSPSPTAGERIRRSISLGANMPLLSKQGFVDVMALDILRDPDEGCKRLKGVMGDYKVWRGLGEVPRECFLEGRLEVGVKRKRKSLLEMSEEKEEVERRIMEGVLRGVGRGLEGKGEEKLGSGDGDGDEDEDEDESESKMPAPESFAFDNTDDEGREKSVNGKGKEEERAKKEQMDDQMEEVDLTNEDDELEVKDEEKAEVEVQDENEEKEKKDEISEVIESSRGEGGKENWL